MKLLVLFLCFYATVFSCSAQDSVRVFTDTLLGKPISYTITCDKGIPIKSIMKGTFEEGITFNTSEEGRVIHNVLCKKIRYVDSTSHLVNRVDTFYVKVDSGRSIYYNHTTLRGLKDTVFTLDSVFSYFKKDTVWQTTKDSICSIVGVPSLMKVMATTSRKVTLVSFNDNGSIRSLSGLADMLKDHSEFVPIVQKDIETFFTPYKSLSLRILKKCKR